ncbi:hypothetical protein C8R44DRAFT_236870 [Mycena epipterygia]|nr:hypothetical protein C8R44DRAFT_236870 [Mycena epipterygia]
MSDHEDGDSEERSCRNCGFPRAQSRRLVMEHGIYPPPHEDVLRLATEPSNPSSRSAQRTRLSELQIQIHQLQSQLDILSLERDEIQTELDRIVYPITRLPNETTAKIFRYVVPDFEAYAPKPYEGPLLLMHVCRRWREIALVTHELWTSIDLFFLNGGPDQADGVSQLVHHWLPHANGRPLTMALRFRPDKAFLLPDGLPATLADHIDQIESLELSLDETSFKEQFKPVLENHPARNLKNLIVGFAHDTRRRRPGWLLSLPIDNAPALRELHLRRFVRIMDVEVHQWRNLTVLKIETPLITADGSVENLLLNCPKLRHLEVYGGVPPGPAHIIEPLPPLEYLACRGARILDFLILPRLTHLSLKFNPDEIGRDITALADFVARSNCTIHTLSLNLDLCVDEALE